PLVYIELAEAVAIGYLAFNEIPSLTVIGGAALIVIAGLILAMQKRSV
ncbi:MAG: EamA family transporter, partial [Sulfitobacter sp.]